MHALALKPLTALSPPEMAEAASPSGATDCPYMELGVVVSKAAVPRPRPPTEEHPSKRFKAVEAASSSNGSFFFGNMGEYHLSISHLIFFIVINEFIIKSQE
jgi:hypothetical protein